MSTLLTNYGYVAGDTLKAKIRAYNLKGWSDYSDDSTGLSAQD